ncbi:TetR/AcrR family transcriptional regulator [Conexibacter sp. CPCC 206217]|uniref:TetR/AcrR family transcriptional regulator n=1 Tax=Conexibacter sp. CPCC 206217 TaxID=3064574 RepID=UPI00271DA6C6|nr:TetR/AcrR family transcriptional regulator [Conexibacter sp. CPCC 206217]MDO8212723.1 TetR/AcrR family transcriptional regulator [Conexibacter sp. CPCC 206217]
MASPRTRMAIDVRREQLLDAGVALFAQRSWEEVSIDEIAAACGVSRGLLYHYFAGKRGFYVASVERAVQRLHETIEPDLALPPTEQLLTGLRRHFGGIEQHADAHTLLLGVAASDEDVAAIVARDREAFAERVLAGMPGAGGGSPLARAAARAWIGAVEAATREFIDRRDVTAEQLVALLAEALVAALLAASRLDPSIEVPAAVVAAAGGGIVDAIEAARQAEIQRVGGGASGVDLPSRTDPDR